MRLCIFSDTHLGFGQGTEREQESFENTRKALEICLGQKADCILLLGDIFDESVPTQETWREAFNAFSVVRNHASRLKARRIKNGKEESLQLPHLPVISIHGTHEFRGKRFANALEVMEKAGFLHYLHAGCIELEKDGDFLAIHGLGGVPEKKALDALKMFGPKPFPGKTNILALHQSIKELLPFGDEMTASISFSDLPDGFGLIANGHFHWHMMHELGNKKFFIPGSTIVTQMKRLEAEKPKGAFMFDTKTMKYDFFELPGQRKLLYETITFENASAKEIKEKTRETLEKLLGAGGFQKKPLVRIKLKGTLAKGVSLPDASPQEIVKEFEERAIVSVGSDFSQNSFKKRVEELRRLQRNRKSIAEIGIELLEKNISETGFDNSLDVRELFSLLEEGKIDEAILLLSKKKN